MFCTTTIKILKYSIINGGNFMSVMGQHCWRLCSVIWWPQVGEIDTKLVSCPCSWKKSATHEYGDFILSMKQKVRYPPSRNSYRILRTFWYIVIILYKMKKGTKKKKYNYHLCIYTMHSRRDIKYEGFNLEFHFCSKVGRVWNHGGHLTEHKWQLMIQSRVAHCLIVTQKIHTTVHPLVFPNTAPCSQQRIFFTEVIFCWLTIARLA